MIMSDSVGLMEKVEPITFKYVDRWSKKLFIKDNLEEIIHLSKLTKKKLTTK